MVVETTSLGACACSPDERDPSRATDGSADVGPAVELTVRPGFYIAQTMPIELLEDGDPVTVRLASQGGYVMYIGARVQGLAPGKARLSAALVDPESGEPFVWDERSVELVASPDGSASVEPDARSVSQFAHLLPCPNYEFRPVHGWEWLLEVEVSDPVTGSFGASSTIVVPTCAAGPRYENCVCECQPQYYFGKCGLPH